MTYRYEEMPWPEVRQAVEHDPVVVLPVGTTEQHGYHLPLMVDYLCADEVARGAVEQVAPRALLMHPVTYSFNEHHLDYPGTISIDPQTIVDYLVCIGRSLAQHRLGRPGPADARERREGRAGFRRGGVAPRQVSRRVPRPGDPPAAGPARRGDVSYASIPGLVRYFVTIASAVQKARAPTVPV